MGQDGKRVVLHVGAHKTGTTVVQQYLNSHVEVLSRRGVRYVPRPDLTPLVGWGEKLVDAPAGFARLLAEFGRGPHRVLLGSHENICGPPFLAGGDGLYPQAGPAVDALTSLLAPFDVTIVLTVRPVDALLESYYLQHVNLGGVTPFDRWLADIDLDSVSWRPLVTRLREAFGEPAVAVVDFAAIRAGSTAYVREVLRRAGLAAPLDESWVRPLNPSVSAQGLRLLLRGNAALADPADRAAVRGFVQRNFSNATGERPTLLSPHERTDIRNRYGAEFAGLVEAHG